ncbi:MULTISPECIES: hypothetical protein [unclassified Streptomyces]|uniref:hypothetical protein n=1 Tax=unclassified Streptomyces TaxID=2593676 RepID=UPI0016612187|nr:MULTISPECIES: hypothetical protein [unclassified Streptomyces]MBD0708065.1 hypothetical protein [Streptomyces sp. CBMA291]MBD0715841.1 hypothetical protein [Streptomyces sp. CBMA370]
MRTPVRLLTGTALTVVALGVFAAPTAYANEHERPEPLEIYPATASPGTTVNVHTRACGKHGHGVGDANALGAGEFQLHPSGREEVVVGEFRVPEHVRPGTYGISVACDNGKTARGDLEVARRGPSGHVPTGVGGSVGPDITQVTAGAAVLAATAVGGVWLLRRRASGAQGH